MQVIKIDEEFRTLIPPLNEDEFQRLEKSILAEGVREPIITWNGTIVDGHNRYAICQKHALVFRTFAKDFSSKDAAKIWIIENQFARRNIDKYVRGVLALQLEDMYKTEAKRLQRESGGDRKSDAYQKSVSQNSDEPKTHIRTDEQIAKLAGMSRDTIRKVKVIENEANSGNETAITAREEVKAGTKSIHGAFIAIRHNGDDSDTRNICTMCGKPINEGDYYPRDRFKHKKCANKLEHENKKANGSKWEYADSDLRENIATYTIDLLLASLEMSAKDLRNSWTHAVKINENMGVVLTASEKTRIEEAANNLLSIIQTIKEERANG